MTAPAPRASGVAGVIAGFGLLVEFGFFLASGWHPDVFADPATALEFLHDRGGYMRAAGWAGSLNLCFTMVFVAGLAAYLDRAPTAAAAMLYLGVIGIGGHALVPIGLWLGTPTFAALSAQGAETAHAAWIAFAAFMSVAGGVGYLFLGLSMIAAGYAGLTTEAFPRTLGWLTVLGGAATVTIILAEATPLSALVQLGFLPAISLSIAFRIWGGLVLMKSEPGRVAVNGSTRR